MNLIDEDENKEKKKRKMDPKIAEMLEENKKKREQMKDKYKIDFEDD